MRARIHRGAQEVGGSCVELEAEGKCLVLDLGRPLDSDLGENLPLPPIPGLAEPDPDLLGVIISHGHPDHWGLAPQLSPEVPLYIGEVAARILREASFFAVTGADLRPHGHLCDRVPMQLGPFTLTPYLVDHSAFDAYALLVEAEGQRLFYSGDLRGHGRKPSTFRDLLNGLPGSIDTLLLEGTQLTAPGVPQRPRMSERDVEVLGAGLFASTDGLALAAYSGQNIDRLVSLYRASKRASRVFVLDLYGATIAAATGRSSIPQADWDDVRVYVPQAQRIRVKRSGEFDRVDQLGKNRLFPEELAAEAGRLTLTFRGSMSRELERADCLAGAELVWSMWHGYLDNPSGERVREWASVHEIPIHMLHASGHATVTDLQRLAAALVPRQVVPIHTSAPERFPEFFEHVALQADGEWWRV